MRRTGKSFECPVCGEDVPANAKSCPECGACEKSGWSGEADELPDTEFDYGKFVAEEFGGGAKKSPAQWFWWTIALALIAWLIWSAIPH